MDLSQVATWEEVCSDGEYVVICPCGFSDYFAADCQCPKCQGTVHPVPVCPVCAKVVVAIEH